MEQITQLKHQIKLSLCFLENTILFTVRKDFTNLRNLSFFQFYNEELNIEFVDQLIFLHNRLNGVDKWGFIDTFHF